MAATAFDKARHTAEVASIENDLDQLLSAAQQIVVRGDSLNARRTAWLAEVAAGTLDQTTVDQLDTLKADVTAFYQAAKKYRDANQ